MAPVFLNGLSAAVQVGTSQGQLCDNELDAPCGTVQVDLLLRSYYMAFGIFCQSKRKWACVYMCMIITLLVACLLSEMSCLNAMQRSTMSCAVMDACMNMTMFYMIQ